MDLYGLILVCRMNFQASSHCADTNLGPRPPEFRITGAGRSDRV
jgi:hypothetical protein